MNCKKCGAEIPAENINLDRAIAKCSECNAVFGFADEIQGADDSQKKERVEVSLPAKISVSKNEHELIITRKWYSTKIIFLTVFAFIWDGFLIFWFGTALSEGIWIMALAGSIHAAVGIGLTYYVIAGYINKTFIGVDAEEILIRHKPLWWMGNKDIPTGDVKQLYCKEKITQSKNGVSITYEIYMITEAGKHNKFITGLEEAEQALYIEQEIERFLKIEDQQVSGEIK